ncbi:hypothetical protein GALL_506110 [mine drainage metagenome]|uniref:Uncharacterized protein n=1 Tax=mine drainage metagenome TaxID=410659 RepID=A0A1J5P9D0_9ZZZZ
MGGKRGQILVVETNETAFARQKTQDGPKCRGLADAVAAQKRNCFARVHMKGDAPQNGNAADRSQKIRNFENRAHSMSSGVPR